MTLALSRNGGPHARASSPRSGCSTLITSAPSAPRIAVQYGPASELVTSTTRTPSSGRNPVAIRARPYETDADLRRMQSLQQELWAAEGPYVATHVGDLAWWLHRPEGKRRLWLDGNRCIAWAWAFPPATLDYEVHHAHRNRALHHEVLAWLGEAADGDVLSAYALETDAETVELLAALG